MYVEHFKLDESKIRASLTRYPKLGRILSEYGKSDFKSYRHSSMFGCFEPFRWFMVGIGADDFENLLEVILDWKPRGFEIFLKRLVSSRDQIYFYSLYSELYVMAYFLQNGFNNFSYEPDLRATKKRPDLVVSSDDGSVMSFEVVTPHPRGYIRGFLTGIDTLFESLQYTQFSEFSLRIRIDVLELFDSRNFFRTHLGFSRKDALEALRTLRRACENRDFQQNELPTRFSDLSRAQPRLWIEFEEHIRKWYGTNELTLGYSSSGRGIPINWIVRTIHNKGKKFKPADKGVLVIDFSHYRDFRNFSQNNPLHREFQKAVVRKLSHTSHQEKIKLVLSFEWIDNGKVINRNVIFLNPRFEHMFNELVSIW
jgi:hypothetical protein